MKIHIYFPFVDGPHGGGNQFLKALKKQIENIGIYEEVAELADVIIFNSHHYLLEIARLKLKNPHILFVHRLDGPVSTIRGGYSNYLLDKLIYSTCNRLADGTVFQSEWSKEKNHSLGLRKNEFEILIYNAPDPTLFYKQNGEKQVGEKTRLIATSRSANRKKGFGIYQWLDKNLDRSAYEMTFVGNSPIDFKYIVHKSPMSSEELSDELRQHDIYITASASDPCSNSLIEALHCGLPSLGLDDGGHPELIGKGGEVFLNAGEIPSLLEKLVAEYETYASRISLPDMQTVAGAYIDFCQQIVDVSKNGKYTSKQISKKDVCILYIQRCMVKLREKFYLLKRKLGFKK